MRDSSPEIIAKEISEAEREMNGLGDRVRRLWDRVCIPPAKWAQDQYSGAGEFWVIAVMGNRCLYLNPIEGGWGWGRFKEYGKISSGYHCCQEGDEIQHAIYQTMFAIDCGGSG